MPHHLARTVGDFLGRKEFRRGQTAAERNDVRLLGDLEHLTDSRGAHMRGTRCKPRRSPNGVHTFKAYSPKSGSRPPGAMPSSWAVRQSAAAVRPMDLRTWSPE